MSSTSPVKVRGGGYGLDAELAKKAAEKYDVGMENEAREWIEAISGMEIGPEFGEGLRNGVILCELANKIHPGVVKRIETKSKMPFRLMENVSAFLRACRVMGVNEFDLFETVDLFELKDQGLVVRCIHALGRAVQKNYPDFNGPTLGVKESIKNERVFSEDQLAEARATPSLFSYGSSRVMERRDISRANDVTFGADASLVSHRAPPPPPPPSDEKIEQVTRERAAPPPPPVENDELAPAPVPTPAPAPVAAPAPVEEAAPVEVAATEAPPAPPAPTPAPTGTWSSQGSGWGDSTEKPPVGSQSPVKTNGTATASPVNAEPEVTEAKSAIDADVRPTGLSPTKQTGPNPEEEAQEWIEEVLSEKFLASFGDSLRDGVILCQLMNKIQPGLVRKIETSSMPFKQMENISNFLKACRAVGVQEFDLFETVDLFELKNIDLVVKCLHALGRTIQKNIPDFDGPTLGVKESTANKRRFSPAQLKQATHAVSMLNMGSHQIMDRRGFDRSASVTFGADATVTGLKNADSAPPSATESSPGRAGVLNRMGASSSALPTRTVWS